MLPYNRAGHTTFQAPRARASYSSDSKNYRFQMCESAARACWQGRLNHQNCGG
ncbi:hypothetical protein AAM31_004606 [Salmonella enterica subsp. enterica]|nr:hypothetical protein [Salmonella enterica subsp. enterica]